MSLSCDRESRPVGRPVRLVIDARRREGGLIDAVGTNREQVAAFGEAEAAPRLALGPPDPVAVAVAKPQHAEDYRADQQRRAQPDRDASPIETSRRAVAVVRRPRLAGVPGLGAAAALDLL